MKERKKMSSLISEEADWPTAQRVGNGDVPDVAAAHGGGWLANCPASLRGRAAAGCVWSAGSQLSVARSGLRLSAR